MNEEVEQIKSYAFQIEGFRVTTCYRAAAIILHWSTVLGKLDIIRTPRVRLSPR